MAQILLLVWSAFLVSCLIPWAAGRGQAWHAVAGERSPSMLLSMSIHALCRLVSTSLAAQC